MSGCNLQKLKEAIISLSSANDWEAAKLEWRLNYIYETDEPDTCLCGHHPIRQLCVLCNLVNGNKAVVGNVCVNKFMGIPSAKVFDAFRRVKKDSTCALNEKAIAYAHERGWITDWEHDFSLNTRRKQRQTLSEKQKAKRQEINQLLLKNISSARRPNRA